MAFEKVFREYIGAQDKKVTFEHVDSYHDPNIDKFDLILSFAIDYDTTTKKSTHGVFRPSWDSNLSADAVSAFKKADGHRNVRVMLSIGGDNVKGDEQAPVKFTPTAPRLGPDYANVWKKNAVESLATIMEKYDLDGIDVNYEHFEEVSNDNVNTFVDCIKSVLQELKRKFPHMATSIAPYDDERVQKYYQALWASCADENLIDYVNFQFYSCKRDKLADVDSYIKFYDLQVRNYPRAKVLASLKTGKDDETKPCVEPRVAIEAARQLRLRGPGRNDMLPGMFIWSADSSFFNEVKNEPWFKHESEVLYIVGDYLGPSGSWCINTDQTYTLPCHFASTD